MNFDSVKTRVASAVSSIGDSASQGWKTVSDFQYKDLALSALDGMRDFAEDVYDTSVGTMKTVIAIVGVAVIAVLEALVWLVALPFRLLFSLIGYLFLTILFNGVAKAMQEAEEEARFQTAKVVSPA